MSPLKAPVYFLSIGGPNFMEQTDHPAFNRLGQVGQEITTQVKPKAVVVISAHWEGGPDVIKVNVAKHADIIYDFFGFPSHYYEYNYPNRGSPEIAEAVITRLIDAGIDIERAERGLDHGVWVGFLAAFNPKTNPLNVPIIQVSLFASEDVEKHYRLGQTLAGLRDEGILVVGAGMAVHNLQDFRRMRISGQTTMPYASVFDDKLRDVVATNPDERRVKLTALLTSPEARSAHPELEHIMPLAVVAGAAGADRGERLWTYPEGSLNWAQYRFGDVAHTDGSL